MSIEVGTERAVVSIFGILDIGPAGQGRRLIVDEETAVLDGRGLCDFDSVERVDLRVALRRYVGKPVPGGDTNLLGNIIDTVDCTSTIASCMVSIFCTCINTEEKFTSNDERLLGAVHWVLHERADIRLPLSFDCADIEFAAGNQAVNQARVTNGSNDDGSATGAVALCTSAPITADARDIEDHGRIGSGSSSSGQGAIDFGHAAKIDSEIVRCSQNTRPICGVDVNAGRRRASEQEASIAGSKVNGRLPEALDSSCRSEKTS